MAYKRKTRTPEELSAACRRAALCRKHCRGGRPRAEPNGRPSMSIKVCADDYASIKKVAAANGITLAAVVSGLLTVFVHGTTEPIKAHPQYAPAGE